MGNLVVVSVGLGVIVLAIALFFPTLVAAPTSDVSSMVSLNVSQSADLNGALRVTLSDVDETNQTATVDLRDLGTSQSDSVTANEGSTETTTISGESVDIRLEDVESTSQADMTVSYPGTFGWSDGAVLFAENMDILLVSVAFILLMGFLVAMLP